MLYGILECAQEQDFSDIVAHTVETSGSKKFADIHKELALPFLNRQNLGQEVAIVDETKSLLFHRVNDSRIGEFLYRGLDVRG